MNNTAQKVTRIDKDAWDIATELANEYGVSICHIISESVRYCAENAEFKEVDVFKSSPFRNYLFIRKRIYSMICFKIISSRTTFFVLANHCFFPHFLVKWV